MLQDWGKAARAANAGKAANTANAANPANADFRGWFPGDVPILQIGHRDSVTCPKKRFVTPQF